LRDEVFVEQLLRSMEALFHEIAETIALALEAIAVAVIAFGSCRALIALGRMLVARAGRGEARGVFLGLARWLLLALEFTLAADVVRTAIAPTWNDIGQLASIAVIRTFLNYFLERDLERATQAPLPAEAT
jgi:uncharacterized membrane protein